MNRSHINKIEQFVKPFYKKTGKFHGADHIQSVRNNARKLAKTYPKTNLLALDAACLLHDIGRSVKDEGHPEESATIARPFLQQIRVGQDEIDLILHAVSIHAVENIHKAKTIEDKLLFDADKMEILSVYGFIRVTFWLMEERKMNLDNAVNFLWEYCQKTASEGIQTPAAKKIITPQLSTISQMVKLFQSWKTS